MRDRPKRSALTLSVPLATGLHRAALACLDDALAEIRRDRRDPERTVHRVRRELKRFRACLRLVRVPQSDWGNALLADATALARQLSPLRDRWVARRTFEHLRMRHPNDCWQVVAKSFPQPPRSGRPAHIPNPSARWERRLVAMRATVLAHAFPPCTVAGLAESLRRSYRTARKTRAAAMARPTPLNIHAWRKAVVRLYHQSAYVRPLLKKQPARITKALKPIADGLGHCGDLALVERRLRQRTTSKPRERARRLALQQVRQQRQHTFAKMARRSAFLRTWPAREFAAFRGR